MAAGVTEAGGDALLAGVLPTPAAPLLVRRHGLHMAAVISASHNPYEDNGIKLFAADGFKLHDDTEHEIEALLEQPLSAPERIGRVRRFRTARSRITSTPSRPALPASISRAPGCCSTAPTAPPTAPRRRSSPPRRRSDGRGRPAGRAQHQRRLRLDPSRAGDRAHGEGRARRRPSPLTATATGFWPWTAAAMSSTETSSWPWPLSISGPATASPATVSR